MRSSGAARSTASAEVTRSLRVEVNGQRLAVNSMVRIWVSFIHFLI
jgi:hypothetical protein